MRPSRDAGRITVCLDWAVALAISCLTDACAARALAPARKLADEVVVAVDVSGGERDLTALSGLACTGCTRSTSMRFRRSPSPPSRGCTPGARQSGSARRRRRGAQREPARTASRARPRADVVQWLARRGHPLPVMARRMAAGPPTFRGGSVRTTPGCGSRARLTPASPSPTPPATSTPASITSRTCSATASSANARSSAISRLTPRCAGPAPTPTWRPTTSQSAIRAPAPAPWRPATATRSISLIAQPAQTEGVRKGIPGARTVRTAEVLERWAARV